MAKTSPYMAFSRSGGLLEGLADQLSPQRCLLCGGHATSGVCEIAGPALCGDCHADLPVVTNPCRHCAMPAVGGKDVCSDCITDPLFEFCVAAFEYAYPVDRLVQAFKFSNNYAAGRALAEPLAQALLAHYQFAEAKSDCEPDAFVSMSTPDVIVPVPLYWWRRLRRSFNQAEEIADIVCDRFPSDLSPQLLTKGARRILWTRAQSSLPLKERRRNLERAFSLDEAVAAAVNGKTVLLIDDVLTTGSTLLALAKRLKALHAKAIHVAVLARTV